LRVSKAIFIKCVKQKEWAICLAAREKGRATGIYVYEFLKEPLIRALGEDVYNQICIAVKEFRKLDIQKS
jgi:hypothetical protein